MNPSGEKYTVDWTGRFKRDYKLAIRRGLDISKLDKPHQGQSIIPHIPKPTSFLRKGQSLYRNY